MTALVFTLFWLLFLATLAYAVEKRRNRELQGFHRRFGTDPERAAKWVTRMGEWLNHDNKEKKRLRDKVRELEYQLKAMREIKTKGGKK